MTVFNRTEFDNHENVVFCADKEFTNLSSISIVYTYGLSEVPCPVLTEVIEGDSILTIVLS